MSPTLVHKIDSVPHAACTNAPHWFERHNLFMTFSVRCLLSQLSHEAGILMSLANAGESAESSRTCLRTHILPVTALLSLCLLQIHPHFSMHSKSKTLLESTLLQQSGQLNLQGMPKNTSTEAEVGIERRRNPCWDRLQPLLNVSTLGLHPLSGVSKKALK